MRLDLPLRSEMADFLDQLRRLVFDEATTIRYGIQQTWSKPLPARVAEGRAIEGVRIVGKKPTGEIELACDRNSSRFREGDTLCLNRGDPFTQPRLNVTLEADEETRLFVSVDDMGANIGELLRGPSDWVLDEGYMDLSALFMDALAQAGDGLVGRERILPLLMGRLRPSMDLARYERGYSIGDYHDLNDSQSEALAQAYATDLAYLIQGPPGTGKTRVLAYLAQALVEEGERVLITSFTHRAINNALNKLAEVAPDIPAIKIGLPTRADDLQVENYEGFDGCPLAEASGGYVIGATPFATRSSRLSGVEFETVIFDEASQITLPLAVMGMLAGKKYIFIGDQKQLPPVLATRYGTGTLRDSVFSRLADRGFDSMLTETFRLNQELCQWPSAMFYDNRLLPAPHVAHWRIEYERFPFRLTHILDPDEPVVFVDLEHRNTTTRSHTEANLVVDLVTTLLDCGFPPQEIGIVAPYRAQGREIRNLLRQSVPDADVRRKIVTDTVERMQGQERDLIIISLTTSNPAFAASLAEFFFQPERLNVAITRPRKKLIVVGSRHVLQAQPEEPELQKAVDLLRDLIRTCAYRKLDYAGSPMLTETD